MPGGGRGGIRPVPKGVRVDYSKRAIADIGQIAACHARCVRLRAFASLRIVVTVIAGAAATARSLV